ncbi:MAG: type II toxin-antitoxin system HicA family toxin [Chloroflexi bacterium]|nr:type II toxin-antitoxin system HicA family toxin [Chloroflexota bacterium]MCI0580737.1 type II toxin-antitoxin system HicA family toxin [Chloroflexota bacterium]MCI0650008.1 type II toxin-antitoxin system HicA family toxin [Chloroflexota bacterium]MCI0730472.1 type II toxin-antitoxin system HicA family toxin [Chloroflexota bacterium]
MPAFGPIKRQELIRQLRKLGFERPFSGGNHQYMIKGHLKLFIPNPHHGDISRALLVKILRQASIDKEEWERL